MATVLSLDVGSTQLRCLAVDKDGIIRHSAFESVETLHPLPGQSEIDPARLWQSCKHVLSQTIDQVGGENVKCIGITTQRSGVLLWDRTDGRPLCKIMTWQDRRCLEISQQWPDSFSVRVLRSGASLAYAFTGGERFKAGSELEMKYQSSAPKVAWCLRNIPEASALAAKNKLCYGGIDSWIIWNLTGGQLHAMDYSHASSTMLLDTFTLSWSYWVLKILGIPSSILPQLKDTVDNYGSCHADLFGREIPITASVADQQSSLFAQKCWDEGMAKCTLGTGTFLCFTTSRTPRAPKGGLYPLVAWKMGKETTYMMEGGAASIGSSIQWACKFGLINSPSESEALAREVEDSNGVFFVPAFDGLQAPHWDPSAATTVIGINHDTKRSHMVHALLESFAFLIKQLYSIFQVSLPYRIQNLYVDGGVTQNKLLMQLLSNLLPVTLICASKVEMTGLGAAYLAGLGSGLWQETDIKKFVHEPVVYRPEDPSKPQVVALNHSYLVWMKAVERSLSWRSNV